MELAAFHLQAKTYDDKKPPAFGDHPDMEFMERERERKNTMTYNELQEQLDEALPPTGVHKLLRGITRQQSFKVKKPEVGPRAPKKSIIGHGRNGSHETTKLWSRKRSSIWNEDNKPLFLEECAHLLSLLSAVAMSTLRNDLETASSPLITFIPGEPFPEVDPDDYKADVRREWTKTSHRSITIFRFLIGTSRNPVSRTLYNAARPFRVIGGVSDAEIELLQAARGPLAKVALVTMWLQEFITREYLAGSTGKVAPPIISRLYQLISDGMAGYNQARKIAYIPFPFPHAQITSLFVFAVGMFLPVLMLQFVTDVWLAFFLNFLTVMSFTGLHEVARELESPFMNVPNDLPCNNFQGQFNEALMSMFAGYHPDSYWELRRTGVEL